MQSDLRARNSGVLHSGAVRADAGRPGAGGVAHVLEPLLTHFFGGAPPVRFEFWDGTALGSGQGRTVQVRSPTRCAGSCGLRVSWAWPGPSSRVTSTLPATSSRCSRCCMPPCPHVHVPAHGVQEACRHCAPGSPAGGAGPAAAAAGRGGCATSGRLHSKGRDAQVVRHASTSATTSMPWCSARA